MALKEQDIIFTTQDVDGNTVIQMPITRAGNIEDVMSIEQGGTGAETASGARTNLGLSTAVTAASISGKTITLTFADGTTKTLTTQDTAGTWVKVTKGTAFTASYNCIAVFYHAGGENYQTVTINGTAYRTESHHTSNISMTFPLNAGDVVTTSNIETVWVMEVR